MNSDFWPLGSIPTTTTSSSSSSSSSSSCNNKTGYQQVPTSAADSCCQQQPSVREPHQPPPTRDGWYPSVTAAGHHREQLFRQACPSSGHCRDRKRLFRQASASAGPDGRKRGKDQCCAPPHCAPVYDILCKVMRIRMDALESGSRLAPHGSGSKRPPIMRTRIHITDMLNKIEFFSPSKVLIQVYMCCPR